MQNQRVQIIGYFIILGVVFLLVGMIFWPFLKLLALAGIMAILFNPMHNWLERKFKKPALAAGLNLILILVVVILPLYLIGQILYGELNNLYSQIRLGEISIDKAKIIQSLPENVQFYATGFFNDIGQRLSELASNAVAGVAGLLSGIAGFVLSFFLVFFALFYFFRDGKKIRIYFNSVLPLSEAHENILLGRLSDAINGVVKGSFLVALMQGAIATVGFLIFGVPSPFLWGAITVLAALVPNVGTSLSLIPAWVYLLLTGHVGAGIGLAIWGFLAVGLIDNVVSPKIIGSRVNIHPLLVLFSILGGLQVFGFLGLILGPIIMAVFMALLDIYRNDLKKYTE